MQASHLWTRSVHHLNSEGKSGRCRLSHKLSKEQSIYGAMQQRQSFVVSSNAESFELLHCHFTIHVMARNNGTQIDERSSLIDLGTILVSVHPTQAFLCPKSSPRRPQKENGMSQGVQKAQKRRQCPMPQCSERKNVLTTSDEHLGLQVSTNVSS